MKDHTLPLSFYKIANKSKIIMLGEISTNTQKLSKIQNDVEMSILPLIKELKSCQSKQESSKLHLKISELLLQSLIKVDGVDCELESEKNSRKELVKWIQGQLKIVDDLKIQ